VCSSPAGAEREFYCVNHIVVKGVCLRVTGVLYTFKSEHVTTA
jgi:hypothetical protein